MTLATHCCLCRVGGVKVSGITFINCASSAVIVQGSTSVFASSPVAFQGCTFLNNNGTLGSAVQIILTATGSAGSSVTVNAATFNSCKFSGNSAFSADGSNSMGGAVLARVTSSPSSLSKGIVTMNFSSCTFTANHADVMGGAVALYGDTVGFLWTMTATFKTCTVSGWGKTQGC